MRRLAYGEIRDGRVEVRGMDGGAGGPADGAQADGLRFDALLMARPDFQVRILEVPPVAEADMEPLLRYRLRSLYPGSPAETVFDWRLEAAGRERRAVVFIGRRETVERYREAARGAALLLPYQLVRPLADGKNDLRAILRCGDWEARTEFRGGLPASDAVRRLEAGSGTAEAAEAVDGVRTVLCAAAPDAVSDGAEFRPLASLAAGREGLFGEEKRRAAPPRRIRLAVLSAAVVLSAVLAFYGGVRDAEARRDALKARYAALERRVGGAVEGRKEAEALEAELARVGARRPADLYGFLSALAAVMDGRAEIRGLTVREDGFRIEAVGANPLALMEAFARSPAFRDVRLSQVVPDGGADRERFSFSGVYRGE